MISTLFTIPAERSAMLRSHTLSEGGRYVSHRHSQVQLVVSKCHVHVCLEAEGLINSFHHQLLLWSVSYWYTKVPPAASHSLPTAIRHFLFKYYDSGSRKGLLVIPFHRGAQISTSFYADASCAQVRVQQSTRFCEFGIFQRGMYCFLRKYVWYCPECQRLQSMHT